MAEEERVKPWTIESLLESTSLIRHHYKELRFLKGQIEGDHGAEHWRMALVAAVQMADRIVAVLDQAEEQLQLAEAIKNLAAHSERLGAREE